MQDDKTINNPDPAEKAANNQGNAIKDPDDWATGEEPITGAQHSYLQTLAGEAGVTLKEGLTKAEASKLIGELQEKTGRGKGGS